MGKSDLPQSMARARPPGHPALRAVLLGLIALALTLGSLLHRGKAPDRGDASKDALCTQADPLFPSSILRDELEGLYKSDPFVDQAAELLGGAVRIATESYDDNGPPDEDPRWSLFHDLHTYLEEKFPHVHSKFTLTKVNTLALVYTWVGTDPNLKPLLLTAHQDVVPVEPETVAQWVQPPYSGLNDGEWIWGRGTCDDKLGVIAQMISMENLISRGFVPTRTLILAYGFDEETGGKAGSFAIAEYLLEKYGEYSMSMIVDEGGGFGEQSGAVTAFPALTEKGYLDVRVQVDTLGGHSSVPPPHTGIGILSALLAELEKNPMEPTLTRTTPLYDVLQCMAEHAPDVPDALRKDILRSRTDNKALKKVGDEFLTTPLMRSLVGTTQAIDLISGGVKVNALPEQAWAAINHRIATDSSVGELQRRLEVLATPIAQQFNMSLTAFGKEVEDRTTQRAGVITLSEAWHSALEPAPRTPSDADAGPYHLLSGTIRATYRESASFHASGKDIVVAPGLFPGNTDTKRYWKLSKHIFRYDHLGATDAYNGAHTINEALRTKAFPDIIRYFTYLILNADESRSID
ncbi:carboxypeptidase S [Exidia glandulosa HHB12029]|uniref:Carboxypeptidase S n=1 Tax=Exidia glandulosa HHB12029 TaxID=1314781 RepID=A0A165PT26_EXIGL|nr:carboxypeptidase S [Exidia glandulosa HHB12029]